MPIYNLNKSTENLFLKIKTKIWWLLLGVLIFCILWGKKLSLLWRKNITEGHNTMDDEESDEENEDEEDGEDKNTILQIISNKNTRLSDSLPATATSSGSRPPARTPSAGSRTPASTTSSGSTTPAPTPSAGSRTPASTTSSGSTTPAPTNSSGSTTPAPTNSSGSTVGGGGGGGGGGGAGGGGGSGGGSGAGGGSNPTCPPSKWKINDKVQIIKPNNAPAVPGTIIRVDINSTTCVYSYMVQLCDNSTNTYSESDLVTAPPPGSAPNSCNSNGRGQNVVTVTTSPVPSGTTSAPSNRINTSNSCNEFTVMVTNGKRDGDSWSYSTNGNRGSIPCPLDSLLQTVDNSPLPGWVCTDAIVVDNANKVLFDRSTCADKQTSDEKWSYSESTKKATVKIPMTDTITTYASSSTHSIFLTYVPKVSTPSSTPST